LPALRLKIAMDAKRRRQLDLPDHAQKIYLKRKSFQKKELKKTNKNIEARGVLKYPRNSLSKII
jgi:hypothetical protein